MSKPRTLKTTLAAYVNGDSIEIYEGNKGFIERLWKRGCLWHSVEDGRFHASDYGVRMLTKMNKEAKA